MTKNDNIKHILKTFKKDVKRCTEGVYKREIYNMTTFYRIKPFIDMKEFSAVADGFISEKKRTMNVMIEGVIRQITVYDSRWEKW